MALTLRLTDREKTALAEAVPGVATSSGKIRHMIANWSRLQEDMEVLRGMLREKDSELCAFRSDLCRLSDSLKFLNSFISGT